MSKSFERERSAQIEQAFKAALNLQDKLDAITLDRVDTDVLLAIAKARKAAQNAMVLTHAAQHEQDKLVRRWIDV